MPSVVDQIAKEMGVSNATVSRALNDRPGVGAALRDKIVAYARELQYTPNVIARGLATSQTFNLGFFIHEKPGLPVYSDPFYLEILTSTQQVIARSDYHVTFESLPDEVLTRPTEFRFVRERRADAMVLAGPDIPASFIIHMLHTGLPVVLVDNHLDYLPANCVNSDDEGGAYRAARFLFEAGHTQIGVVAGPPSWASTARRVRGYRRAADEAGIALTEVHADETTIESGQAAYTKVIERQPAITALCAVNDSMAIGAIRAARAGGRRVPDDLSVIGFDDIAWAVHNDPPLTTVRIPRLQMGKEVAHRLLTLLADPDLLPSEIIVPVELIQRGSTA
jgi:DNA-binding LacI/PurR family transcriptional regulator